MVVVKGDEAETLTLLTTVSTPLLVTSSVTVKSPVMELSLLLLQLKSTLLPSVTGGLGVTDKVGVCGRTAHVGSNNNIISKEFIYKVQNLVRRNYCKRIHARTRTHTHAHTRTHARTYTHTQRTHAHTEAPAHKSIMTIQSLNSAITNNNNTGERAVVLFIYKHSPDTW